MRRFGRALRSTDTAMLVALLACGALLWAVRVQGPASVAVDPFGNADQYNYFYPLHRLVAERLRHAELPLWDPQQLAGVPLLATPQAAVFYPPNWLHLWLPVERAFSLLAFAHLCWAVWLTYALCRSLGAQPLPAAIGGASYAWSSYVVGCHLWPPCLAALSWFALPLLGIALLERAALGSALCVASGVAMLLVCGHLPLALFGLQAAAAYAIFRLIRLGMSAGLPAAGKASLRIALAALAGVLLAAPQWLPTLELVQLATRNPHGLTAQQLEPFGPISADWLRTLFEPAVRGGGYAGVCTLLLLPLAALTPRGGRANDAVFFAVLALCFALVSLGSSTPLYALYKLLPGTSLFRGPVRALCLFVLGASVSGALCVQQLWAREPDTTPRAQLALLGAGALALLVCLPQIPPWHVIAAVAALATAVLARGHLRTLALAAIGCSVLADLVAIPPTPDRQVWRAGAQAALTELAEPYRELAQKLGSARCLIQPAKRHALATAPRVAAQYGLRVFEDYEPLSLQRYADYATFLQRSQLYDPEDPVLMFAGGLDWRRPWLQRRLLTAAGVHAIARVRSRAGGGLGLDVEWLPEALPRAYIAHELRPAGGATDTLRSLARAELGGSAVALEHLPTATVFAAPPAGANEAAVIVQDEPERVVIEATLAAPGALVLLDTNYPGWRARVNAERAPIYTANYLFRAVLLPAGKHRVVFEYVSHALFMGVGLCMLGLALLVGMALSLRRSRSARPPQRDHAISQ